MAASEVMQKGMVGILTSDGGLLVLEKSSLGARLRSMIQETTLRGGAIPLYAENGV